VFDNNIDVTNSGGDQHYGQNVHWRIVSGMVADLVGDCERSRRQHEMGQDSHPALGEHEKGKYRKYEANDGNKIVQSIHFGGPTLSAGHDRHISRFPMLDCKPKLLSKTSLGEIERQKKFASPLPIGSTLTPQGSFRPKNLQNDQRPHEGLAGPRTAARLQAERLGEALPSHAEFPLAHFAPPLQAAPRARPERPSGFLIK
jgi:hypothetical protein